MLDFMDAVFFGFKSLFRTKTIKFAMTSGVFISLAWIVLGYFLWDGVIAIASSTLELIPFSLLRSNGAWMLSAFLWLQLVLITFALIFSLLGNIIVEKVQKEKYGSFSVIVGFLSAAFWSIVWFFEHTYIYAQFLKLLTWLPFETIEKGLAYLIGFYIIYTGIIVSMIFVTSIVSSSFLSEMKKDEFPYDTMYEENEYKTIIKTLTDMSIFILISVLSFPLLFIPFINFFILVGLWTWMMKDTIAYDTSAFVFGKVDKNFLKENRIAIWGLSIIGAFFNFIPVFNVFGPYFTELSMFYYFKEKRER